MRRRTLMLSILLILMLALAACPAATPAEDVAAPDETAPAAEEAVPAEEGEEAPAGGELVFWSTETQPERAALTQAMLDEFAAQSGIEVELVVTDEDQLPSLLTASVAAGTLPDVLFFPVDFTIGWAEQGILNPSAATEVINELGVETFAQGPLEMVQFEGEYAAVPSDGWGQLLIFRQDLFEEAGLERPDTYEQIRAAAEALHDPENNFYGITASTDPGAVFTQQTFEHFALANDCQLVTEDGEVVLDTPECITAVEFFADLMNNFSPPGVQDVDSTRATYFAGQAAMIVWSPFILDEMAGLRVDAFPACPECEEDPAFLALNSGIVPAFVGPNGDSPAQYGQVSNVGISATANVEAAQEFLRFWFTDGYLDWLALSPEGKFPMRQGTPEEPDLFIEGWRALETGVDTRAALSAYYSVETVETLLESASNFERWGFAQGQGALISALYESLIVPRLLADVLDEVLTVEEAVQEMALEVMDLQ